MTARQKRCGADTVADVIAGRMRSDIFHGVLVPGERITIARLAKRYGVSHLPVREALRMIEGHRLVRILPRRGALVRSVDHRVVSNIYDCRAALDSMAAGKCATQISPSQVDQLQRFAEAHRASLAVGDSARAFAANRDFHAAIYSFADNEDALRMVQGGWELVSSLRRQFGISDRRQAQAVEEHFQLIEAYRSHNRNLVLAVTVMHCELAKQDLLQQMRAG
jgi:DNA-binding GntR family transcriptional regulator